MIRTTALPVAALLAATLLAPTTTHAAGETCQGVPATHVGSVNKALTGTDGPDVIVTHGASPVDALGGDDLICVTRSSGQVDAGSGNDVVWATERTRFGTTVHLGPGSDRFTGSATADYVTAGDFASDAYVDADRDVIDGGPFGIGVDVIRSGQKGLPNPDEVRITHGSVAFLGIGTDQTVLAGGPDATLRFEPPSESSVVLDAVAETWTQDGAVTRFSGFGGYAVVPGSSLSPADGPRSLVFRGSPRGESLEVGADRPGAQDIRMEGGTDTLRIRASDRLPDGSSYDGGAGRNDTIELVLVGERDVDLDLGRGVLSTGPRSDEVTTPAAGFEHAAAVSKDVELVGSDGRNTLSAWGCRVLVDGRAGADQIAPYDGPAFDRPRCGVRSTVFRGASGNDTLIGSRRADTLLGGAGRDTARGRAGRDVCQAETTTQCEVRR